MDKKLPSSPGAERYIITCCLNTPDSIVDIVNRLKPEDFYFNLYRYAYQICISLVEEGLKPEPMTVYNRLESIGIAKPQHLKEMELLAKASYDAQNLDSYIDTLRSLSARRQLIDAMRASTDDLYSKDVAPSESIEFCESRILDISSKISNTSDVYRVGACSKEVLKSRAKNPLEVPGIPTGYDKLDVSLQGLQPGKLYVLAARYKVGKSIWLMNVVRHVAVNLGVPVLVIDTENPSQQIDDRMLSLQSGVEELKVRNGMFKFEEGATDKLNKASDVLGKAQIYHCYMPNFTFEAALSLIKKYKMQKNIGLVVFDYIKSPDNTDFSAIQEYQMLGHLTSGLKNKVAGTLNIPVLTACQLGRKAIGQDTAADDHVADSDRIGRYADVLLYFREKSDEEKEKYGCTKHTGNMVLTVQINRGGPAKDFAYDLYFDKPCMSIKEVKARSL